MPPIYTEEIGHNVTNAVNEFLLNGKRFPFAITKTDIFVNQVYGSTDYNKITGIL